MTQPNGDPVPRKIGRNKRKGMKCKKNEEKEKKGENNKIKKNITASKQ